ncbi:MAG: gamma-glutamyl-gamma-aminobutyrate hydrolase family protein [Ignavibacteriae bacterium]|nr:gamma-glutamyl-gamma-aminobutyrate hydrolase family protein [Ignavibacteriota bacterium]
MNIGITDTRNKKIDNYIGWIRKVARNADVTLLSHEAKNAKELKNCDGLILTGGGDIHPRFYGREDCLKFVKGVKETRDEFEMKLVRSALKSGMPILGICRGMQVFNVALGGSMIPDLATEGHKGHAKTKEGKDRRHVVEVEKGTNLHWIVETSKAETNSAHHQAVDRIAEGLRVTAKSRDGIVEGLEWQHAEARPFLQLVQWHPERMEDFSNPCSKNLLEHFMLSVVAGSEHS